MRGVEAICSLALLAASVPACDQAEARNLPPASGPGSPVRADLPLVSSASAPASSRDATSSRLVVTGSTHPIEEAHVGPKSQGIIVALPVDEGDTVKKGQLLFRLDGAIHAHSVAQAKAGVASAEVARDTAETDFQRTASLRQKGAVSQATHDQMKSRRDSAKAAVAQTQAALRAAQQMSADTAVFSPIDGIVSERKTNVGELPPPVVLTIENITTLEVRARLPERALTRVKQGTKARVRFQTGVERTVAIERLSPSVDAETRTFEIVALLPNEDHQLKAGMLVQVDFGPAPSTLPAVPSSAPRTDAGSSEEIR